MLKLFFLYYLCHEIMHTYNRYEIKRLHFKNYFLRHKFRCTQLWCDWSADMLEPQRNAANNSWPFLCVTIELFTSCFHKKTIRNSKFIWLKIVLKQNNSKKWTRPICLVRNSWKFGIRDWVFMKGCGEKPSDIKVYLLIHI